MQLPKRIGILGTFLLTFVNKTLAQDAHFSQQYATKLNLNPAFAGLNAEANITAAYRNQWPSLSGSFITNQLSADMHFGESKSAAGILLNLDQAGSSVFKNFELSGIYAYQSKLSKKMAISAGLQATYGSLKTNYNNLIFGDQLSDDGLQKNISEETKSFNPLSYFSIGTGVILYNDQFWFSLSADHLNRPDLGQSTTSPLYAKTIINSGYKFYAKSYVSQNKLFELSFTPTVSFTKQGPFNKLDLGLYTKYTPITFGLLYRGIPIGTKTEQSLIFITGLQLNSFKFAYSYDLGLSGLSAISGGAHEITVAFEKIDFTKIFRKRSTINKNYIQIACPEF